MYYAAYIIVLCLVSSPNQCFSDFFDRFVCGFVASWC